MTTFIDHGIAGHPASATSSTITARVARSIAGIREVLRARRHAARMTRQALAPQSKPALPAIAFLGLD